MPRNPLAPAAVNRARSTIPDASHRSRCGTISRSTNLAKEERNCSCVSSNSPRSTRAHYDAPHRANRPTVCTIRRDVASTSSSPLRVPKTAELVAHNLRKRIVRGELREGESLPAEATLTEQFGVSRPTLREAFRVLETEQLITVRRGARGGAAVHAPSAAMVARYAGFFLEHDGASLADVLEARVAVESPAAGLAAERRTTADLDPPASGHRRVRTSRLRSPPARAPVQRVPRPRRRHGAQPHDRPAPLRAPRDHRHGQAAPPRRRRRRPERCPRPRCRRPSPAGRADRRRRRSRCRGVVAPPPDRGQPLSAGDPRRRRARSTCCD